MSGQTKDAKSYWEATEKKRQSEAGRQLPTNYDAVVADLQQKVADASMNADLAHQELAVIANQYAHFENKIRGIMRSGPKEFEVAVDIFDYVTSRVGIIMAAKPFFHPKRGWPPFWQISLGIVAILFSVGVIFTPFGGELGRALQIQANQIALIVALVAITIVVVVFGRRSNRGPQ